ncbi:MAG TPA: hypothetical protein VGR57_01785, partial [Ktedonobacterales bacterium]|nr:hypothetical protein [Ktedonobacterales bacterium]
MPLLDLRSIGLPIVLYAGIIALVIARGRAASPRRAFLLAFWGSTAWLTLGSATAAMLLWADESRAHMAGDYSLLRAVGWAAI